MNESMWHRAEEVANEIRRLACISDTSRVHLHAAARGLPVRSVQFVRLPVDGQVEWTDGFADIKVRTDMAETRKRFSLAHELAHVALNHRQVSFRNGQVQAQERLCNAVAAELLIPARCLRSWVKTEELTLSSLRLYADELTVSRAALVRRLAEATDIECLLVSLTQRADTESVIADKVYGRIGRWYGPTPQVVLDSLVGDAIDTSTETGVDEAVEARVWYDGRAYDCRASVGHWLARGTPESGRSWALLRGFTRRPDMDA